MWAGSRSAAGSTGAADTGGRFNGKISVQVLA